MAVYPNKYNKKTNWQEGEYVTAADMNKIEQGIYDSEVYTDEAIAALVSALQGTSAPTTSTVGTIGQKYLDTNTKNLYECVGIGDNSYTWKLVYKWVAPESKYYLVDADGDAIDISNLLKTIAPAYVGTQHYKTGVLLTYESKLYEGIKDNIPVGTLPTNTTYFKEVSVDDVIKEIESGARVVGKSRVADNFDSKMVLTDNSGYLYRTTGGSLEVGEQNRVKKIIGASVPIIQYIKNGNFESTSNWTTHGGTSLSVANNKATVTIGATHTQYASIYEALDLLPNKIALYHIEVTSTKATKFRIQTNANILDYTIPANKKVVINAIRPFTIRTTYIQYYVDMNGTDLAEGDTVILENANYIDLTATFGTTVANRLYALEQAQAGAGIAKAKEILVKDYYPYNVTAFTHTKTSGKVNNGFNQWDEQWEVGRYDNNTGAKTAGSNDRIRNKTPIPVFANTAYYAPSSISNTYYYDASGTYIGYDSANDRVNGVFTTPSNCAFVCFFTVSGYGTTYKNDICINLHWDGERDGEYEAYQEWNYPVQDIELKGILSLDAQDNWVADGDEYLQSGVVNENYYEYTVTGNETMDYGCWIDNAITIYLNVPSKHAIAGQNDRIRCSKYGYMSCTYTNEANYFYFLGATSQFADLDAFKSYIAGAKILFKLSNPSTDTADSYTELQNDSNWGTEKWIDTRDVPMPVFSTCEYIPDLKAKVETAPESPTEDGDYIMHRENGLNSYGSLSTAISALGIAAMSDADYNEVIGIINGTVE